MPRTLRHRLALLLVALTPLAALAQPAPPKPADPALLAELDRDIWQPFVKAFAERDAEGYIALHSPALVRGMGDMKRVETYASWRENTLAMFKRLAERDVRPAIRFRFLERIAGAEAASERGIYEFTATDAKGEVRRFYGKFHVIARKEEGRWKIAVDYDSSEGGTIDEASFRAAHAMDDYAKY